MSIDDDALLAIIAVILKKKEDEKKKTRKRLWMKDYCHEKRNEVTYANLLEEINDNENDFRHFLASDASIYEELLNMIGPLIKKKDTLMREAIPVGLRFFTTLRFLANGCHFENMKSSSGMSPATISKIVLETCEAIIYRLKDYIKVPETPEDWKTVAKGFNERWNFPNCLGVVNGMHIAIIKPTGTNSIYYNYKKFFSVVLLAVVNANYEFLAVDVAINGNVSGHEDFRHTSIGKAICGKALTSSEPELPYIFVGNEGFQIADNFMKAYQEKCLTKDKKIYNYHLKRVHKIIENTVGALCSQFGVLQRPINLGPEKVKTIVLACCYLYNYLRRKTAHNLWDGIFDKGNVDGILTKGSWREVINLTSLQTPNVRNPSVEAERVRQQFVHFFNNK